MKCTRLLQIAFAQDKIWLGLFKKLRKTDPEKQNVAGRRSSGPEPRITDSRAGKRHTRMTETRAQKPEPRIPGLVRDPLA